jgi:hypothetical protein
MRHTERLTARVHEFAFQRVFRRIGNRVQQQVQLAKFFADGLEDARDVFILGHVARQNQGVAAERASEFLDVFLEAFALISERQFRALARPRLRDGPGDGAFVGDAEDNPSFSVK